MTNGHPTDLALEKYLLDRTASSVAGHVDGCDPCRGRIARMEEDGRRFRQFVYPATVEKIEAAAKRRTARWWMTILAPVPALAAAAALVLVLRPVDPAGPPDDYVGLKGASGIGIAAFVQRGGVAKVVPDRGTVTTTEALRFRVRTTSPCHLFIISVDGRGAVSRLDTDGSEGVPLSAGLHDLPGGVELDGSAGPERIFAVCAPSGVTWPDVERAGRAAGAGGAERVRATTKLGGLPKNAVQATLLLEKKP